MKTKYFRKTIRKLFIRLPTTHHQQIQQEATLQQIVNLLNNMDQRLIRLEVKCDQNTSELKDIREESISLVVVLH